MRGLTSTEIDQYNRVRSRHPELNLPEISKETQVEYVRQGPTTLARVAVGDAFPSRHGWAVYSPIDRIMKKPDRPEVGEAVAFNRALKTPIWT